MDSFCWQDSRLNELFALCSLRGGLGFPLALCNLPCISQHHAHALKQLLLLISKGRLSRLALSPESFSFWDPLVLFQLRLDGLLAFLANVPEHLRKMVLMFFLIEPKRPECCCCCSWMVVFWARIDWWQSPEDSCIAGLHKREVCSLLVLFPLSETLLWSHLLGLFNKGESASFNELSRQEAWNYLSWAPIMR